MHVAGALAGLPGTATVLLFPRQRRRRRWLGLLAGRPDPRAVVRAARAAGILAVLTIVGAIGVFAVAAASLVPDRVSMASHHNPDFGGGPTVDLRRRDARWQRSVATLTGPQTGNPDATFTLTAEDGRTRLSSGIVVDTATFNGQVPGPELRVRQGDLVEVNLVNRMREDGVTVHWHGLRPRSGTGAPRPGVPRPG